MPTMCGLNSVPSVPRITKENSVNDDSHVRSARYDFKRRLPMQIPGRTDGSTAVEW